VNFAQLIAIPGFPLPSLHRLASSRAPKISIR